MPSSHVKHNCTRAIWSIPCQHVSHPVQSRVVRRADLAAEKLGDPLLPLGFRTALTQAPLDAALCHAVDVQWRRQPACTLSTHRVESSLKARRQ